MNYPTKICFCCNNEANYRLTKINTDYYQCVNCRTIFCDELEQSGMVGGQHEKERNEKENDQRIARIDQMTKGAKKEDIWVLDIGCGNFLLGEDLKKAGYPNVDGFDLYNEKYRKIPEPNKYSVIVGIEFIEHTAAPYTEVDLMHRCLKPGGGLLLETSFTDVMEQEGFTPETFFYLDPNAGHSTFFSHWGMDVFFSQRGFRPMRHFNRHCRLFQKTF